MNFDDEPEEAAFRREVRAWLDANAVLRRLGPVGATVFEDISDPADVAAARAWQRCKADAGWAGILWPKEYGGREGSLIEHVIWAEEEARYDVPDGGVFGPGIQIAGSALMTHGTDTQQARYLSGLLRGEEIYCQLFSEPGAGSDLAATRTEAVRDGDQWVLRGQKVWTSMAHVATFGIALARTDFDAPKHRGLTAFLVDLKLHGIDVRPIRALNGGTHFNEVFFNDVRIHDSARLGEIGGGWTVATTMLLNERIAVGVPGNLTHTLDSLLALARESTWEGRPAIESPDVRQRLASYFVKLEAMRLTDQRVRTALSRHREPGAEASIGKLVLPALMQEVCAFAMELQGPKGVTVDDTVTHASGYWQEQYLFWPALRIGGGTDEIQRNIIAERILSLPREPSFDRDAPFREVPQGPRHVGPD